MKILAISGSLRSASVNTALLRAIYRLAPAEIEVDLFAGLGELPLFNPDLEVAPPPSVQQFRLRVTASDAVIIASPEYAHGITGAIKNGLDWLVSHEPFAGKFVAVLNSSPRAHHANAALREILKTMAAVIVESASITIPLLGAGLDESDMVNMPSVASEIRVALGNLYDAVASAPRQGASPSAGASPSRR